MVAIASITIPSHSVLEVLEVDMIEFAVRWLDLFQMASRSLVSSAP